VVLLDRRRRLGRPRQGHHRGICVARHCDGGAQFAEVLLDEAHAGETAHDVSARHPHYLEAWKKDRVILVGYSFGADVMPFVLERLAARRAREGRHREPARAFVDGDVRGEGRATGSAAPRMACRSRTQVGSLQESAADAVPVRRGEKDSLCSTLPPMSRASKIGARPPLQRQLRRDRACDPGVREVV
jgi:hypothetical protein